MPLKEGLQHADPAIREATAATLALRTAEAIPLIPLLVAALDDGEVSVRHQAATTLGALGPVAESAIPPLIARLKDQTEKDRNAYALALRGFGADASAAVPALIGVLNEHDSTLSKSVLRALAAIGPSAEPAVADLILALNDQDQEIVTLALQALGAIGPGAKTAVPALITLAFEKRKANDYRTIEDRIPYEAVVVLGKIGPDAEAALPGLMRVIANRRDFLIYPAIEALSAIGPGAEVAIPILTSLAFDLSPGNRLRCAAAEAVFGINPLLAEQLNLESAFLDVHLEKVPAIKLQPRVRNRESTRRLIKSLIKELPEIAEYGELGFADLWDQGQFAPLSDYYFQKAGMVFGDGARVILMRRNSLKTSRAFRRLVELGPVALPDLLEALDSSTPTNLPPTPTIVNSRGFWERKRTDQNPVNPVEEHNSPPQPHAIGLPPQIIESYTPKLGDLCLAAIEQIVGRKYLIGGRELPGSIADSESPASRKLRDRVRKLWAVENPETRMFESLLADFSTRGISHKGVGDDSWIQTNAAMRLLYYFPHESDELVASRLQALDVQKAIYRPSGVSRDEINGVQTVSFISAVAWCKKPAVLKSLRDIAARTDDPGIQQLLSER
jgi:HEAT repeat protein